MRSPPSLAGFINWVKVLNLLGIQPDSAVLPCETQCPVCNRGKMRIFHDHNCYGVWIYCRECRFAGDIIELAMETWKGLDIRTTIKKLIASGIEIPVDRALPVNVDLYVQIHINRRKKMWALWEKARKRLLVDDSKVLRQLQHKLGIRLSLDRDRWLEGPGLYVGGIDKPTVEETFAPNVHAGTKGVNTNAGSDRVFVGPKWTDVLMIPFNDFPGRVKGYLFYGREGRFPEDTRYKLIRYSGEGMKDHRTNYWRSSENDCGIGLYESIWYAKDTVFVMNDPFLALKMQSWHLQDNGTPAPIVSMFSDTQVRTNPQDWGNVKQRLIFWGKPTAELFRHARATNSLVSTIGFGMDGPVKTFHRTTLADWLERIKIEARPWEEVLEENLAKLPIAQAETILIGMELDPGTLVKFLRSCPDDLKGRLEPCVQKQAIRTIQLNETVIREEGGWYIDKTAELISNAVLRIEEAVYHPRLDQTYYTGRVLIADRDVPFYERATTVEANTFRWMRHLLQRANAGFMEFAPKWEPLAVSIATRFHPPEMCQGLDSVGWNQEQACFVFPEYRIDKNGEVCIDQKIKVNRRRTPALMLGRPERLNDEDIVALSQQPAARAFWAITSAIAANILSPAYNTTPKAIGIVGEEDIGKPFVKALGCSEFTVREQLRQASEESLTEVCNEHGWPLYLRTTTRVTAEDWLDWLTNSEKKNCVVSLNWYTSRSLMMRHGWYVIEAGDFIAHPGIFDAASKILPSFLQYLAKKRLQLELPRMPLIKRVNDALANWFAEIGGDPKVVLGAIKAALYDEGYDRQESSVNSFADLLCRLYDDGEITLERAGFLKKRQPLKGLIVFPAQGGGEGEIFIPKGLINRILSTHDAPMLSATLVLKALLETKLGGERKYAGLPGWWLKESHWNKRLEAWQNQNSSVLRLET